MSLSTAFMPCDASGAGPVPFDPAVAARWGIADFDWSNGKSWYSKQAPMNCEETLLAQAEATHALNPTGKQMVYRNAIKALPWFTSVREKLEERAWWGFFLPFKNCTRYECGPNATQNLYHDFEQTPRGDCGAGVECGEYVFDLRNSSCLAWLSGPYLSSPTGMGSPAVHGFYFDDGWQDSGPTEMDPGAVAAMGLSPADVRDLVAASKLSYAQKNNATVALGGFPFTRLNSPAPFNATSAQPGCAPFLRENCGPAAPPQASAFLLQFSRVNHTAPWPLPCPAQDLARFLLVRGDYAWLGYGWAGCFAPDQYVRPPGLDADYGTALNFCSETGAGSGVFTRNYTGADVALDCNAFEARIDMRGGG